MFQTVLWENAVSGKCHMWKGETIHQQKDGIGGLGSVKICNLIRGSGEDC